MKIPDRHKLAYISYNNARSTIGYCLELQVKVESQELVKTIRNTFTNSVAMYGLSLEIKPFQKRIHFMHGSFVGYSYRKAQYALVSPTDKDGWTTIWFSYTYKAVEFVLNIMALLKYDAIFGFEEVHLDSLDEDHDYYQRHYGDNWNSKDSGSILDYFEMHDNYYEISSTKTFIQYQNGKLFHEDRTSGLFQSHENIIKEYFEENKRSYSQITANMAIVYANFWQNLPSNNYALIFDRPVN